MFHSQSLVDGYTAKKWENWLFTYHKNFSLCLTNPRSLGWVCYILLASFVFCMSWIYIPHGTCPTELVSLALMILTVLLPYWFYKRGKNWSIYSFTQSWNLENADERCVQSARFFFEKMFLLWKGNFKIAAIQNCKLTKNWSVKTVIGKHKTIIMLKFNRLQNEAFAHEECTEHGFCPLHAKKHWNKMWGTCTALTPVSWARWKNELKTPNISLDMTGIACYVCMRE